MFEVCEFVRAIGDTLRPLSGADRLRRRHGLHQRCPWLASTLIPLAKVSGILFAHGQTKQEGTAAVRLLSQWAITLRVAVAPAAGKVWI